MVWPDFQDVNIGFKPITTVYSAGNKLQNSKSSNHTIGKSLV